MITAFTGLLLDEGHLLRLELKPVHVPPVPLRDPLEGVQELGCDLWEAHLGYGSKDWGRHNRHISLISQLLRY